MQCTTELSEHKADSNVPKVPNVNKEKYCYFIATKLKQRGFSEMATGPFPHIYLGRSISPYITVGNDPGVAVPPGLFPHGQT